MSEKVRHLLEREGYRTQRKKERVREIGEVRE